MLNWLPQHDCSISGDWLRKSHGTEERKPAIPPSIPPSLPPYLRHLLSVAPDSYALAISVWMMVKVVWKSSTQLSVSCSLPSTVSCSLLLHGEAWETVAAAAAASVSQNLPHIHTLAHTHSSFQLACSNKQWWLINEVAEMPSCAPYGPVRRHRGEGEREQEHVCEGEKVCVRDWEREGGHYVCQLICIQSLMSLSIPSPFFSLCPSLPHLPLSIPPFSLLPPSFPPFPFSSSSSWMDVEDMNLTQTLEERRRDATDERLHAFVSLLSRLTPSQSAHSCVC